MESTSRSNYVSVGLAIFSMLFGAGNLMYPIKVGLVSGDKNMWGLVGFLLTAVALPLLGIIAMILFDGDYKAFFSRLGRIPSFLLITACMIVIGPLIAMPRIVTLSHIMMEPFLPTMSPLVFAIIFLGTTFLFTYKESKIIDVLGKFISPALVISLLIIIIKGIATAGHAEHVTIPGLTLFKNSFLLGYETIDLLGAIFFSSIILTILKNNLGTVRDKDGLKRLASFGFIAGIIGVGILALIYVGLSLLGVYHAQGLEHVNSGILFREVSLNVMGVYGAFVIAIAVFFACLSTAIALAAVVGDFLQRYILKKRIKFVPALATVLLLCLPLSMHGLDAVLRLTGGSILYIGYPMLITLTFCNIAYKLFGFRPVKLPVLLVGIAACVKYFLF